MGFRVSVSLHPAIQATGRLTFAPAGLIPAEHTSLHWTHKRSQYWRPTLNDFLQADRGQPPQRTQKHRSKYRRRQATFPMQCRSPWPHRRDGDRCAGGCGRLQSIRSGYYCGLRCPIGRGAGVGVAVSQSAVATAARHDNGNRFVRNTNRPIACVQTRPPNSTNVAGNYLCRFRAD